MQVVITGGPGAGKAAFLDELSRLGFATVGDTPRAIIRSRRARGLSPRPPPLEFAEKVLHREVEQYALHDGDVLTFFERGVIDALLMMSYAAPERWAEAVALAADYSYHRVALFLPPWEEIYVNDEERDHPFSTRCASTSRWSAGTKRAAITSRRCPSASRRALPDRAVVRECRIAEELRADARQEAVSR